MLEELTRPRYLTELADPDQLPSRQALAECVIALLHARQPKTNLHWRSAIDGRVSGVYSLFSGEELVYIGKSKDIPLRMRTHCIQYNPDTKFGRDDFETVAYFALSIGQMDIAERRLIRAFKPRLNRKLINQAASSAFWFLDDLADLTELSPAFLREFAVRHNVRRSNSLYHFGDILAALKGTGRVKFFAQSAKSDLTYC